MISAKLRSKVETSIAPFLWIVMDSLYRGGAIGFDSITDQICSCARDNGTRVLGERRVIARLSVAFCAISPRRSLPRSLRFGSERGIPTAIEGIRSITGSRRFTLEAQES